MGARRRLDITRQFGGGSRRHRRGARACRPHPTPSAHPRRLPRRLDPRRHRRLRAGDIVRCDFGTPARGEPGFIRPAIIVTSDDVLECPRLVSSCQHGTPGGAAALRSPRRPGCSGASVMVPRRRIACGTGTPLCDRPSRDVGLLQVIRHCSSAATERILEVRGVCRVTFLARPGVAGRRVAVDSWVRGG